MRTCSSCKWWGKKFEHAVLIDTHLCEHPMVCQPEYGKRNNKTMRADGVLTMDEGGYTGELITGPDFGCIHLEARDHQ